MDIPELSYNVKNNRNLAVDSDILFYSDLLDSEWYFCKNNTLPGITVTNPEMYAPGKKFNTSVVFDNDTITYNPLSVTMLVDENLEVWKSVYRKLILQSSDLLNKSRNSYLTITDSQGYIILILKFIDCSIMDMSDLSYSSDTPGNNLTFDLTINYTEMQIVEESNYVKLQK